MHLEGNKIKMMSVCYRFALLIFIFSPIVGKAGDINYDVSDRQQPGVILRYALLEDASGKQTISDVQARKDVRYNSGQSSGFGFTGSAWWLYIELSVVVPT